MRLCDYVWSNALRHVWTGDFLIVASGDADAEASTAKGKKKAAVTSIVEHILYKDQVKHLKAINQWYAGHITRVMQ